MPPEKSEPPGPRLGISACLLGRCVRYDGGHKRDVVLIDAFGRSVEWVPVCPEVECGLPVPREPMHLVGDPEAPRLLTRQTGIDHTERMTRWIAKRLGELAREGVDGFIFKSRSPSCGTGGVAVHDRSGAACGTGAGLWARAFRERFPDVSVAEEADLHDVRTREDFARRITSRARRRSSQCLEPRKMYQVHFSQVHFSS